MTRNGLDFIKFQHTAARRRLVCLSRMGGNAESFNTQPPEGGCIESFAAYTLTLFQHTAARRRLQGRLKQQGRYSKFQHTAARRRLLPHGSGIGARHTVSTHSRPKAAGG